jgi:hypothetical protein
VTSVIGYTTATTGAGTSSSTVIAKPTGVQTGDWLIAAWRDQNTVASDDMSAPGFARITAPFVPSSAAGRITGLYAHQVTDATAEPASYTFTRTGTATRRAGVLFILRPDEPGGTLSIAGYSTPYEGVAGTDRGTATYSGTGLTLVVAGAEHTAGNDHALTAPAGYTTVAQAVTDGTVSVSRTSAWVGYKTSATTVAAVTVDWPGTATAATVQSVTLAYTPPPAPVAIELEVVGQGTGVASVWDGSDELPVTRIDALPWTGYTITEMDADVADGRDVYWAHRGGSLDWPEMTERAYTNAVWRGGRALEVSVRRSSDGVWIMSHDATLTRATGGASTATITATHSSAMLGVPVTVGTPGGVIGRIEDVLEAWPRMLWVIDNKTGESAVDLFAIIKARVPDWADRVIIKIDGAHAVSLFQTARAAGFKTAAYFFGDTADAKITENMPHVDYPGMDYLADQARWDYLATFGKPIWGHVLPSLAAKVTAETKGARIFQCAAVKAIVPAVNDVG